MSRDPTLEWVTTLCADESHREVIRKPFSVTFDGQKMIGATDGHAMTLVRLDGDAPAFEGAQKIVDSLADAAWSPAPFAKVEAWALRQNGRCEECGGLGFTPEPALVAFDADGSGPVGHLCRQCFVCRWSQRVGTIQGVRIDRGLLLRYLAQLTTGQVAIATSADATTLALRAPGWLVVVRAVAGTEPGEVFAGGEPGGAA